jgi:hypothetical protein
VHYEQTRRHAGRAACPSVVITDGQSVTTTERGGARGFDAHKRVKGRKRHILVDTFGLLVANRVKPADTSDQRAGACCWLFPRIWTAIRVRQEAGVTQLEHERADTNGGTPPSSLFKAFARRIIGLLALAAVLW